MTLEKAVSIEGEDSGQRAEVECEYEMGNVEKTLSRISFKNGE